jgi:hypothetical protein
MTDITIPHNWTPRDYQIPLFQALEQGTRRACVVWHRRAGKDATSLHLTVSQMLQRVGTYWHLLPTIAQGRKVIWDGITKEGRKVLDAFPTELVAHRRNDEMKIELLNGSVFQVVGSDNYDSLVGSNPIGVVFSEYSLADPAAWDFVRPILSENNGYAIFIYTPRGRSHGWTLYNMAKENLEWYTSLLTVEDTGAIPLEAVEEERKAGMSEEMISQEYYCSFEAPLFGAYYADQMMAADKDERITTVSHDPALLTNTSWDLGIGDSTSVWFYQLLRNGERHYIDYYEASGESLSHYVKVLQSKPYVYDEHLFPHDVKARELIAGKTREEVLKGLGVKPVVIKQHRVDDRIEATRNMLSQCWFDAKKCERESKPVHDWASHGADAFGYGAMHNKTKKTWAKLEYTGTGIV